MVGDVPVYDGAVTTHLTRGDALSGFTAGISKAVSGAATQASVTSDEARDVGLAQVPDAKLVDAPNSTSTPACRSAATRPRWPGRSTSPRRRVPSASSCSSTPSQVRSPTR